MTPSAPYERARADRGFTLVELLIAISVLGLLTVLGGSLLHLGARSWERTHQAAEDLERIEATQSVLRAELARAMPRLRETKNETDVAFEGGQDSLEFEAPLPIALGGQAAQIHLFIDDSGKSTKDFVMAWRLDGNPAWSKAVLLPLVASVRYLYYGPPDNVQPPGWQSVWTGRKMLPRGIKLAVEFPQGDTRSWPEFIAAPMITADVACIYSAITKKCGDP